MERLIIVHWDKSTGPQPIIQYPPAESFPPKDLFVKLWTIHELNKEHSMLEFVPEGKNWYISISQQFKNELYFLVLAYSQDADLENVIDFDILTTLGANLIKLINTNKITRSIYETFNTIKDYSKLDIEENLMSFFQDKLKITLLQILQEGVISKSKLSNILKQKYGFSNVNIDLLLTYFIRDQLIVKKDVPGSKECYFLIKDLSFMRVPPQELLTTTTEEENNEEDLEFFCKKIKEFYFNYDGVPEIENKTVIHFLVNNQEVYRLLKALREKNLSVNECLNILDNNEDLFSEILEKQIIFESKGIVYLLSDFRFIKFTPYYLIKKLIKRYNDKEISLDEYLAHLKLLITRYQEHKSLIDYEIMKA